MTCMTGIVDGAIPSSGDCVTLRCPNNLISLVDTSFHALLCVSSSNVSSKAGRNISSPKDPTEFPCSREALQSAISSALRCVYAGTRHAAKLLARALDIETRTARSYLDGERIPNGYTLIQLMGQCRELRDEINRRIDSLEAAHQRGGPTENKTNNSVRSDNAEFGVRGRAQARTGCGQTWRHEGVALWPTVLLVDGWPGVGRDDSELEGTAARERCVVQSRADSHQVGDE